MAERNKVNANLLNDELEIVEHTPDRNGVGYPEPYKQEEAAGSSGCARSSKSL